MADDLSRHHAAQPPAGPQIAPLRERVQEARRVGIARTGRIDHPDTRLCRDDVHLVARNDDRSLFAARESGDFAVRAHARHHLVKLLGLVERENLVLVGEQDVDVMLDQFEKLIAEAGDTESVRQRQRHLDPGLVRRDSGIAHGRFGTWLIPEIALEVHHLRRGDAVHVEILRPKLGRRAEKGLHRALGVWRDEDQASRRRHPLHQRCGVVGDTSRADIVAEDLTELIGRNLADVGDAPAERCNSGRRVSG